jgi:hypothetical protein
MLGIKAIQQEILKPLDSIRDGDRLPQFRAANEERSRPGRVAEGSM